MPRTLIVLAALLAAAPTLRAQTAEVLYAPCTLAGSVPAFVRLCGFDAPGAPSFVSTRSFPADADRIAVAANGQRVAYLSGSVYVANPDGTGATAVVSAAAASRVAISRDGARVAFTDSDGLHVADVATGTSTLALAAPLGGNGVLEWSPDGTRLLYSVYVQVSGVRNASPLYTVPADGSAAPTRLTSPDLVVPAEGQVDDDRADWSFDGGSVAFVRTTVDYATGADRYQVYRVPAGGGTPQVLFAQTGTADGFPDGVEWSPDGSELALHWTSSDPPSRRLYTLPSTGGTPSLLYGWTQGGGGYIPESLAEWVRVGPPTDIVVNVTGDEPNASVSTSADVCDVDLVASEDQCTLRAAIELANHRGGGRITFDIPGSGVPRINVPAEAESGRLPAFTAAITVDGTTQPGGWVELVGPGQRHENGASDPLIAGIEVSTAGGGSVVRGLVVHGFRDAGILLRQGADDCLIEGNRVGTDVTGTQARGNGDLVREQFGGGFVPPNIVTGGVEVYSSGNTIRGNVLAGNVWAGEIVGNAEQNVEGGVDLFFGPTAFDNRVEGNRIGVGAGGVALPLPPLTTLQYEYIGIGAVGGGRLTVGGPATGVPGTCTGTCNLTAGHQTEMYLAEWHVPFSDTVFPGVAGVTVEGNVVGVDASGAIPPSRQTASVRSGIGAGDGRTPAPSRVAHNLVAVAGRELSDGIDVGGTGEIVGNTVRGDASVPDGTLDVNHVGIRAGGSVAVRGNLVTSNTRWGILAGSPDVVVEGNEVADNRGGIIASGGRVAENHVHGNGIGVLVQDGGQSRITANRIYDNRIGIDLTPLDGLELTGDGVTPNDYGDGDTGGNGLQNFPNVLQATLAGGVLSVSGFVSTPFLSSATYDIEAYLSTGCRSEATRGGMVFGQGERFFYGYQTVASLGEADIDFAQGGVPAGFTHLSFTAARSDTGETSEFSRCVPIVGADQASRANVAAGQNGPTLDGQGTTVSVTSSLARGAGDAAGSTAALHDGGTLYVSRYEVAPSGVFAESTATAPDGSAVTPVAAAARYWLLADRGLTTEGGATSSPATFSVCLDPTGVVLPGALSRVVVVRRSDATGGRWTPAATTLAPHGDRQYLCTDGVASLGEFGIGGAASAFPVASEDSPGAVPERLAVLALAAYPNPVRGAATVEVAVPEAQRVSVAVYDLLGRRVAVLHDGALAEGTQSLRWDAGSLPSGVYVVRAASETAVQTQRVTVVR